MSISPNQNKPTIGAEIIATKVREHRNTLSIWLDGGKLSRLNWNKGDTVEISQINENSFALRRANEKLPRSTESTHNFSGKRKPSRQDIRPVLDLPIKKANVAWGADTALKVMVKADVIIVTVNDYVEQRRQRVNKMISSFETGKADHLVVNVDALTNKPSKNLTSSADVATLAFNPEAPRSAKFFNAMMSIEKANPFAIEIKGFDSAQNTMQDGLLSVLRSLKYTTLELPNNNLMAVSNDLGIAIDDMKQALPKSMAEIMPNVDLTVVSPVIGEVLANKEARKEKLVSDIQSGQFKLASFFHGGGTVEQSTMELFKFNDLKASLSLVNEIEEDYLHHSFETNREAFTPETLILNGDISDFDPTNGSIHATGMIMGIVCKGASRSGRSVLKLKNAEAHSGAGHLFYPSLKFVANLQPSMLVIENTDSYLNTSSFDSILEVLKAMDYDLDHGVIDAHNYGTTETRKRLFLIACDDQEVLQDQSVFDGGDWFVGPRRPVSSYIDQSIKDDDPSYREYKSLKEKEIRDIQNGKGFRRPVYKGHETRTLLIRQSYVKAGSCDPYYQNPSDPEKSRLFSTLEHCGIKGFQSSYILKSGSTSTTLLHSILGQGWTWHSANKIMGDVIRIAKDSVHKSLKKSACSDSFAA